MIQHETSVYLNQPVEKVFTFLMDNSKVTTWQANLIKLEQTTDGPLRLGSRFHEVRRLGKKDSDIEGEVTALEPNKRFETTTLTQPRVIVNYFFEPEGNGTRLTRRFVMLTRGFMRLMEPVIRKSIKQDALADFESLKRVLEN